ASLITSPLSLLVSSRVNRKPQKKRRTIALSLSRFSTLCSRLAKESARFVLNQPRGFRSRLGFGRGKRSSEEIAGPRRESLAA
ncbi:unnamed protein product, partial [Linum tenue]